MPRENLHKWYSPNLSCEVEMLSFGHEGFPIILFPTAQGRYYETKEFKLIDSVSKFLKDGLIKIYCPDSFDSLSWHNKSIDPAERVKNHIWYDLFLFQEVIPFAVRETGVGRVATAGCDFGGYHATNFGLKHPEMVKYVLNMSASYNVKSQLDGYSDDNVYFNSPMDYLPYSSSRFFDDMFIIMGTCQSGAEENAKLATLLEQKRIKHWLDVREYSQCERSTWCEMFPHYLSYLSLAK